MPHTCDAHVIDLGAPPLAMLSMTQRMILRSISLGTGKDTQCK